jgi:hypothetical protein
MPERSDGSRRLSGVHIFHNLATGTGPKHTHMHLPRNPQKMVNLSLGNF